MGEAADPALFFTLGVNPAAIGDADTVTKVAGEVAAKGVTTTPKHEAGKATTKGTIVLSVAVVVAHFNIKPPCNVTDPDAPTVEVPVSWIISAPFLKKSWLSEPTNLGYKDDTNPEIVGSLTFW